MRPIHYLPPFLIALSLAGCYGEQSGSTVTPTPLAYNPLVVEASPTAEMALPTVEAATGQEMIKTELMKAEDLFVLAENMQPGIYRDMLVEAAEIFTGQVKTITYSDKVEIKIEEPVFESAMGHDYIGNASLFGKPGPVLPTCELIQETELAYIFPGLAPGNTKLGFSPNGAFKTTYKQGRRIIGPIIRPYISIQMPTEIPVGSKELHTKLLGIIARKEAYSLMLVNHYNSASTRAIEQAGYPSSVRALCEGSAQQVGVTTNFVFEQIQKDDLFKRAFDLSGIWAEVDSHIVSEDKEYLEWFVTLDPLHARLVKEVQDEQSNIDRSSLEAYTTSLYGAIARHSELTPGGAGGSSQLILDR